ncbi:MAG: P-loop NTPase [Candidatus Aminicenantes bacterium]|nr:P-loop NTPase [Candidatus Aminicenantes bacterium]NIM82657.1 P-loop NTPase [Candidatus Aminicenantes bacterium]NIN22027.1 P-loop NTPase [Candidatus Aminicenantes bacterium]NIN45787.1 P-loop NTPase [Candidatus Aminicenantes bacterium]NIN88625.1 P-loop NTPase [Candidatus Aminicenantes bacterium]
MRNEAKTQEDKKVPQMLEKVKNRLLIFSGKGGVGKSTVAANLALALSQRGMKVGLMDVDIHGPNLAKMLGVEHQRIGMQQDRMIPVQVTENLKLISMAFLLERFDAPVVWRGPLKMRAIQQFLGDVEWGELDWLICDSPPGTGDEPLSVAQLIPATAAVIVTTPQEVSILDSRKAVTFARLLKLKILGVIENMSGFACPHCGKPIQLFKKGGGEKIALLYHVPFLGQIPIDPQIVESGDSGRPFMLNRSDSEAAKAFDEIVENIIGRGK